MQLDDPSQKALKAYLIVELESMYTTIERRCGRKCVKVDKESKLITYSNIN